MKATVNSCLSTENKYGWSVLWRETQSIIQFQITAPNHITFYYLVQKKKSNLWTCRLWNSHLAIQNVENKLSWSAKCSGCSKEKNIFRVGCCYRNRVRKGWEVSTHDIPAHAKITATCFATFFSAIRSLKGKGLTPTTVQQKKQKQNLEDLVVWRVLGWSGWRGLGRLHFITFSHLADAFVQSDVQGREYSSYEQ